MRELRYSYWSIVLIVTLFVTSGCASFQGGSLKPVKSLTEPDEKPRVEVDLVEYSSFTGGDKVDTSKEIRASEYEQKFINQFRDSEMFSKVDDEIDSPDIQVQLNLTERKSINYLAGVTGYTFFIIPSSSTVRLQLDANIPQYNGQHDFEYEESVRNWMGLIFIPAMPTNFPSTVSQRVEKEFVRNLIKDMKAERII